MAILSVSFENEKKCERTLVFVHGWQTARIGIMPLRRTIRATSLKSTTPIKCERTSGRPLAAWRGIQGGKLALNRGRVSGSKWLQVSETAANDKLGAGRV